MAWPVSVALVFVGSGAGGVLRLGVAEFVNHWWRGAFPLGTVLVNLTGCLAVGALATLLSSPLVREEHRALVLIGVLGGYTTFSAFGRETLSLIQDGRWILALLNVLVSNVLGLAAVWLGWAIAARTGGHAP